MLPSANVSQTPPHHGVTMPISNRLYLCLIIALTASTLGLAGCEKSNETKPDTGESTTAEQQQESTDESSDEDNNKGPLHAGVVSGKTSQTYIDVRDTIEGALSANSTHTILARIDYPSQLVTHFGDAPEGGDSQSGAPGGGNKDNADASSKKVQPGVVFLLSQPNSEVPLIKAGQTAGLDLPQPLALWRGDDGQTSVSFNAPSYLAVRHGIDAAEFILMRLGNSMEKVVTTATGIDLGEMPGDDDIGIEAGAGIKSVRAFQGTDKTAKYLAQAVKDAEHFKLVEQVNHTANAEAIDQTVRPIHVVYAIHRKFGPALYRAAPSVVIDYPFRFAALEDADGVVKVSYTSPEFLAKRHGIKDEQLVSNAEDAMRDLAKTAAEKGEDN
jgi:uncharacterized protein (DUF302 family)